MDAEHLGEADWEADSSSAKPKDAQNRGQGGQSQAQVRDGQHRKEVVHGLVEPSIHSHDEQDGAVSQNCDEIHQTAREENPAVETSHPGNAGQQESQSTAAVPWGHACSMLTPRLFN